MSRSRHALARLAALLLVLPLASTLRHPLPASAQSAQSTEITSQDSQPNFALHVQHNEVLVRVVVRDAKGQVVTELQKDDFHLFDNGKPQVITHFSLETSGAGAPVNSSRSPGASTETSGTESAPAITLPRRFMPLFFDDIHVEFGDLVRTRDAAEKYLATNMQPGDRIALFTSSGQNQVDFTDDRAKLHDGLLSIRPRPMSEPASAQCPSIFPYQGYKIAFQKDPIAIQVAVQDAIYECCNGPGHFCRQADLDNIDRQARHVVHDAETETRYVLWGLGSICRRMAAFPGQRSIVLVSPGFMILTETYDFQQVVDQALRLNVVINTFDARGLYVNIMGGDASERAIVNAENPSAPLHGFRFRRTNPVY